MPKGFSEKEKAFIRQKLINVGKEIFGLYGFKKAGIDEAVRKAGISKGAFYLFFDSKAAYFMEVLDSIECETRQGLGEILKNKTLTPAGRFKAFLLKSFEIMEQNPIMSRIRQEDLETLLLDMPEGKIRDHMDKDMNFMLALFSDFQGVSNRIRRIQPDALRGFFMFLFFIFQHKNDIGGEEYRAGLELFIDMVSDYFFHGKSVS